MELKQLIGKRVLERRLELNISQDKLRELSNVDKASISKIENGNSLPELMTIIKLALAMQVNVNYFIQDIEEFSTDLTRQEEELLSYYRKMSEQYQDIIRDMAIIMYNRGK
jgi:transcriptional regulator with XRE-family HTH domain